MAVSRCVGSTTSLRSWIRGGAHPREAPACTFRVMNAVVKLLKVVLAVVVALAVFVKLYLLAGRAVPETARFSIQLEALRAAAGPLEECPAQVHVENVAQSQAPAFAVIANGPFSMLKIGQYAWRVTYADGGTGVIDSAQSQQSNEKYALGDGDYFADAWSRQEKALVASSFIVATHEHYDHLGAAESAHFEAIAPKLKLTAAQRTARGRGFVERDLSGPATLESGPEGSLHVVAPGVVAIASAGHSPGSQMLFVRLKTGPEYLLVGDVVWQEANLERLAPRPRLVSLLMGEDDEAITHQLRAIVDFKSANPSVDVVVSHDVSAMERRFKAGLPKAFTDSSFVNGSDVEAGRGARKVE